VSANQVIIVVNTQIQTYPNSISLSEACSEATLIWYHCLRFNLINSSWTYLYVQYRASAPWSVGNDRPCTDIKHSESVQHPSRPSSCSY